MRSVLCPAVVTAVSAALLSLAACAAPAPPAAPAPDAAPKRVRIVHTNDFHGNLLPSRPSFAGGREVGGSAVLAAHFDSAAARFAGPTWVISAGDDMQGTAVSNLSWGRATIDAHNAAGYDAAATGNHEFDWGIDTLRARIAQSRFPWLAANLFVAQSDTHPSWIRPWVMLEERGVRTAIVGAALPTTPEIVLAGRVAGLRFDPAAPAIARAARAARAAGADFVVATMHIGAVCETPGSAPEEESRGCRGEVLEVAESLAGTVDLVVGGHTHNRVMTTSGGVPVMEAAYYGRAYSVTDLERRGDSVRVVSRSVRVPYADEVTPDTAVARVVARWNADVRPLTERVIATSSAEMADVEVDESPLGNLIADAFRRATGAQATIVNTGSIRRPLPAGPITYGMLYELQPFQNALVRQEVTGAQLRAALEAGLTDRGRVLAHVSGLVVTYDSAAPRGSRIREIRLEDGRVVGDADRVTLGLTEFVATGGDRFSALTQAPITQAGLVDLDAVIAHLQALPQPIAPPSVGRWRPAR
jgi:2',3'-cyclic-nucleotide 2'-phosphodiesterase (5'-nucleotidase family)